jgi:protein O-mannosyl-transferase
MTSLAGLLYIVGLFCFLKARLNSEQWKAVSWYVGAFSACLLALGSKENAIIFPLALILIEVSFFRPILFSSRRQRIIFSSVITLIVFVGTLAVLVISEDRMTSWFESYAIRDFNHSERLLTQFRILPYYLFQIVYPNPANLSLEHDFIVSTGLLTPWSTLLSVTLVFGALWSLLFFLPKAPLLCFGGLFFLLQHVVESSFLPLELIFEHRNYVPTMFLFTGVASGLYRLVFFYKDRNILLSRLLVLSSALVVFFIGMGTYSRNTDWRTERSLWEDTVAKAPENSRALHNLAWGYYEPIGDNDKALELYQQSIGKQTHRKDSYGNSYHNIGNIYFNKKAYAKAIDYFEKSLGFDPYNLKTHLRLVHSYMGLGDWDKADLAIEEALKGHSHKNDLYRLRGAVLLNKNDPKEAIQWFRKTESMQWKDLSGIGQCLHLLGYHEKSDFFLRSAQAISQNDMFLVLNRLDLYLSNNQMDKAKEMADLFVRSLSASEVGDYLQKLAADNSFYPLQYQRIIPVIEETLHEALDQLEKNEELMALTR